MLCALMYEGDESSDPNISPIRLKQVQRMHEIWMECAVRRLGCVWFGMHAAAGKAGWLNAILYTCYFFCMLGDLTWPNRV